MLSGSLSSVVVEAGGGGISRESGSGTIGYETQQHGWVKLIKSLEALLGVRMAARRFSALGVKRTL